VWGVDRSEEMLAHARERVGRTVGLKRGTAEDLPFTDGWFERAVMRLVVHHVDRARAFPELARVLAPGGRLVIATFGPEHMEGFWLNPFFPTVERIDRERFADPAVIERELVAASFASARTQPFSQRRVVDRETALERIRGRFISTLHLVPDDELAAGIARAEAELPDTIGYELHWALIAAER
jgi:ubiquinone/menaquinone biosynthesis C-methylase UbiE